MVLGGKRLTCVGGDARGCASGIRADSGTADAAALRRGCGARCASVMRAQPSRLVRLRIARTPRRFARARHG
jgi:hypothetical protein